MAAWAEEIKEIQTRGTRPPLPQAPALLASSQPPRWRLPNRTVGWDPLWGLALPGSAVGEAGRVALWPAGVRGLGMWIPVPFLHTAQRVSWSLELKKLWSGCQDVRSARGKTRARGEPGGVSDKLFTGFLEGASAIFQSVKVAFLPSEQCPIVVCVSV